MKNCLLCAFPNYFNINTNKLKCYIELDTFYHFIILFSTFLGSGYLGLGLLGLLTSNHKPNTTDISLFLNNHLEC